VKGKSEGEEEGRKEEKKSLTTVRGQGKRVERHVLAERDIEEFKKWAVTRRERVRRWPTGEEEEGKEIVSAADKGRKRHTHLSATRESTENWYPMTSSANIYTAVTLQERGQLVSRERWKNGDERDGPFDELYLPSPRILLYREVRRRRRHCRDCWRRGKAEAVFFGWEEGNEVGRMRRWEAVLKMR
jgi:hypothetical protein